MAVVLVLFTTPAMLAHAPPIDAEARETSVVCDITTPNLEPKWESAHIVDFRDGQTVRAHHIIFNSATVPNAAHVILREDQVENTQLLITRNAPLEAVNPAAIIYGNSVKPAGPRGKVIHAETVIIRKPPIHLKT